MRESKRIIRISLDPQTGEATEVKLFRFSPSRDSQRFPDAKGELFVEPLANGSFSLKEFKEASGDPKPVGAFIGETIPHQGGVYLSVLGPGRCRQLDVKELPIPELDFWAGEGIRAIKFTREFFQMQYQKERRDGRVDPIDTRLLENLRRLEGSNSYVDLYGRLSQIPFPESLYVRARLELGIGDFHRTAEHEFNLPIGDQPYSKPELDDLGNKLGRYGIGRLKSISYTGPRPHIWHLVAQGEDEGTPEQYTMGLALTSLKGFDAAIELRDQRGSKLNVLNPLGVKKDPDFDVYQVFRLSNRPEQEFINIVESASSRQIGEHYRANFDKTSIDALDDPTLGSLLLLWGKTNSRSPLSSETPELTASNWSEDPLQTDGKDHIATKTEMGKTDDGDGYRSVFDAWFDYMDEIHDGAENRPMMPAKRNKAGEYLMRAIQESDKGMRIIQTSSAFRVQHNLDTVHEYFADSFRKTRALQGRLGIDEDIVTAFLNKRSIIFDPQSSLQSGNSTEQEPDNWQNMTGDFQSTLLSLAKNPLNSGPEKMQYVRERDHLQEVMASFGRMYVQMADSEYMKRYGEWETLCRTTANTELTIQLAKTWLK